MRQEKGKGFLKKKENERNGKNGTYTHLKEVIIIKERTPRRNTYTQTFRTTKANEPPLIQLRTTNNRL